MNRNFYKFKIGKLNICNLINIMIFDHWQFESILETFVSENSAKLKGHKEIVYLATHSRKAD